MDQRKFKYFSESDSEDGSDDDIEILSKPLRRREPRNVQKQNEGSNLTEQSKIIALEARIKVLEAKNKMNLHLEKEVKAIKEENLLLIKKNEEHLNENRVLKLTNVKNKKEISELKNEKKKISLKVCELEEKAEEGEDLFNEVDSLQKQLKLLEGEKNNFLKKIEELKSEIERMRQTEISTSEINERESKLLNQIDQIEEINAGMIKLQEKYKILNEENEELKLKNFNLENDFLKIKKENETLQNNKSLFVETLEEKIKLLENENVDLKTKQNRKSPILKTTEKKNKLQMFLEANGEDVDQSNLHSSKKEFCNEKEKNCLMCEKGMKELKEKIGKLERRKVLLENTMAGLKERNEVVLQSVIDAVRAEEKLVQQHERTKFKKVLKARRLSVILQKKIYLLLHRKQGKTLT
eukprot:snap_masked-scaffold_23-processed-gene-5.23-mRNA-1 protein AED:1.00 eAED:1.00 QI:0/0/0/0/1/1/2/0/409